MPAADGGDPWRARPRAPLPWRARPRALLEACFALDLRSLALFRIALAAVVLGDLAWRARNLTAFYTDAGLLPRDALRAYDQDPWHWSLHVLGGSSGFEALLFALAAICALMLLVGWHTRLAAIATWALLLSVQARNPLCLQGGDILLRCLAFWGMLLPLGAAFSLDRARSTAPPPPPTVLGPATVALALQMSLLYWCSSALKTGPEWHADGTAVWYALSLDQFATAPGRWLRGHPGLCALLTHATIVVEAWGPCLLYAPALLGLFPARVVARAATWGRLAAIALFVGFHAGLGLCMELGPFPLVAITGWLALLPSGFWTWAAGRPAGITVAYDGGCGFCKTCVRLLLTLGAVPGLAVTRCQDHAELLADMRALDSWVVVDASGTRHHRFAALAVVLARSRLWWPLAPVMRLPPVMALGTAAYRWTAAHRGPAAGWMWFMRPLRLRVWLPAWPQLALDLLTTILLAYVVLWNLRSLHDKPVPWPTDPQPWSERLCSPIGLMRSLSAPGSRPAAGGPAGTGPAVPADPPLDFSHWAERWFPVGENWIVELPGLDQYWNMFSPMPLRDDGWYVLAGKRADGSVIDLLTGAPPVATEPADVAARYRDERWRKYLMNLYCVDYARWRPAYAQWAFAQWNREHPDQAITSLEVRFWKKTNRFGQEPVLAQDVLVRYP
jgi:predicted DCC family thiol-disulfide oxidoreductase YuxK